MAAAVDERFADELACFEPTEPEAGASPDAARGAAAGASVRLGDATRAGSARAGARPPAPGARSPARGAEPPPSSEVVVSEPPRAPPSPPRAAGPSTLAMNFTVTPSTS